MGYIHVKKANCKNCYKCLKYCQVKSIRYINDRVDVLDNQCILCGKCINICPQHAKTVVNNPSKILDWLSDSKTRVIATIAPSYIGLYGVENRARLFMALKKLGFDGIEETAVGADAVTREYKRLMDDAVMPSILTTSCPTVNMLITRHYPDLIPYLAPVVSPVLAHGRMIKHRDGKDTRVVFIGPCLSKIKEIDDHPESADGTLSFRQLDKLLNKKFPDWAQSDDSDIKLQPYVSPTTFSSIYPVPEGILRDIKQTTLNKVEKNSYNGYHFISISGLENVIAFLQELKSGSCNRVFAELNACDGGCVNGPLIPDERRTSFTARMKVEHYASNIQNKLPNSDLSLSLEFRPELSNDDIPDEQTIRKILTEIGKPTSDKELNCGSCGYPTCREKAIAVYQKKAELYMCLPYMSDLAQSLSSVTLSVTPNYIIAVDRKLRVVEINTAAQKKFGVSRKQALKSDLYNFIDPIDFEDVFENKRDIIDKKVHLGSQNAIIMETLVYVNEQDIVIGFFKDITEEESRREALHRARLESAEMAQRVIEKQMIAAQEIASLLGETTAETKVTLNNLKSQILKEEDL